MAGRSDAASLRAIAALALALGPIAALIRLGPDIGYWLPAFVIGVALVGALLLRQPIRAGSASSALALAALPGGIIALAVALGMAAAAGATAESDGKIASFALFLAGSLLIVAKAFGEELLFRGLLQPLLCRAWGALAGIALAALAFTALHVIGGWRDPVSLLNITLAGGWFGLLAWRTGGILAPTLAHAGYNWAEEMLFGATPNPGISPFGALFDVDLTGPVRLGGSADGLNASLLLTAVLAAIILPLLLRGSPGRAQAEAKQETRPGS
jgi:uncharacterized protein